jgi:hypothetical protein
MQSQFRGWVTPAIVGVASFAGGAVAGYFFQKYRDSAKFDTSIQDAAADITDLESQMVQLAFMFEERDRKYDGHLQQMMRVVRSATQDVETFLEEDDVVVVLDDSRTDAVVTFAVDSEDQEWNEETDDHWDYDEEVAQRGPEHPYVIHRDEFFAEEMDYSHSSLMYYKGDDILVDELDVPIYNADKIVGNLNFGHGSQDPHIVYIRNDRLKAEYEVLLDYGTFAAEILGQGVTKSKEANDFKHSLLRFRTE